MGSFGERLRREREMRGISLDEIATATKISSRNLRALEEQKFDQLPGGIFNRGFVRAYAKFLGIDEEQIVAEYVAASHDSEEAREEKLKAEFAKPDFKKSTAEPEIQLEPKSQWGSIAVIVLIAVLAYGGYNIYQKKKAERDAQQRAAQAAAAVGQAQHEPAPPATTAPAISNPSSTDAQSQSTPAEADAKPSTIDPTTPEKNPASVPTSKKPEVETTGSVTPNTLKTATDSSVPSTPASASPINLKLKVNQESWVSVRADGRLLVEGTLSSGTERSFKAKEKIEMKLGKADRVEVTYNGKPVENLAQGQDVRKITFTPSGYE